MNKKKLKGKKILITGINGFIGNHLQKRLNEMGADVYGISRKEDDNKISKINIVDFSEIDRLMKEKKIEICFHLAAEALVESGQIDPYQTFKTNILGTLNILESARKNNLTKIIIASTSHVYGHNKLPYREIYSPKPSRPYETSKACVDLIAQSYANSFSLPVLIPRFVNIYGPGDMNFDRLIPKTIKSVLSGKSPTMWGGGAVRDYLYVDDAIDAYVCLAQVNMNLIGKNRIFNFGTGNTISVKDLIERIISLSGKKISIERIEEERQLEIDKQYVSWKKASRLLNWKPKISLDEGFKKTILWYSKEL